MIPRGLFEGYARALGEADGADGALRGTLERLLAKIPDEELAEELPGLIEELAGQLGRDMADVARDFYGAMRGLASPPTAYEAISAPRDGAGEGSAAREAAAAALGASASREGLVGLLEGQLVRIGRQRADRTILLNARRDPARPKWALVPNAGACGFCVMIGSRGFDYAKEGRVPRHAWCRCVPVADFDAANPALEGYNPDAMYDAYADARATVADDARRAWDAMGDKERERYTRDGKTPSFDAYLRNRITAEMDRRDKVWLQTRRAPAWGAEDGARPNREERETADALASHGFDVQFRKTRSSQALRTSDCLIGGEPWEIKRPKGDGKQTLYHQFEEAAGQSRKLVLDLRSIGPSWTWGRVWEALERLLDRYSYKTEAGGQAHFEEVLIVSEDLIVRRKRNEA